MIIYLYHGTTLEKALSILENRIVKGKKASNKHHNRYVFLSKNKLEARQFGEVVIRFENIENGVPVDAKSTNKEVAELAIKGATAGLKLDEQIVLKNKHDFSNESVTIYLVHDDVNHLNEMKKQLSVLLKDQDKLTKNAKMFKDYQDWKK